jgi:hypothetical protein
MIRGIKRRIFITAWLLVAAFFLMIVLAATLFTGGGTANRVNEKLYKALNSFSYWLGKVLRLEKE